ncbi:MAG: o-succinylbenzoate synthase [Dehalococcoidales bacterium]|nr:o-succinylbenzoate synthase [Dehalococcoidales bacterium]
MKIEELHIYHVAMPLIDPWITSYGADYEIHSILINGVCDGYEAWSETCALELPTYSYESANSIYYNISEVFGKKIIHNEYETPENLNNDLGLYKGNPFAKAGLEILWWTLASEINNIPLHKLLGGTRNQVKAGADFGVEKDIDTLLQKIQPAVDNDTPRVKLKIKKGWDKQVLEAVSSTFPKTLFHVDCNGGYSLEDIEFFKSIDKIGLAFIEQPFEPEDLIDHAKLSKILETPICLDESINSINKAKQALEIEACKYINIKPGRVGGITNSLKINSLAEENGIPTWIGGMLESALGVSICIALATLNNFTYPGDLFPSSRFYKNDLCEPINNFKSPYIFEPSKKLPKPNKEFLKKYTIKEAHLK